MIKWYENSMNEEDFEKAFSTVLSTSKVTRAGNNEGRRWRRVLVMYPSKNVKFVRYSGLFSILIVQEWTLRNGLWRKDTFQNCANTPTPGVVWVCTRPLWTHARTLWVRTWPLEKYLLLYLLDCLKYYDRVCQNRGDWMIFLKVSSRLCFKQISIIYFLIKYEVWTFLKPNMQRKLISDHFLWRYK